MKNRPILSVIICTCDRGETLRAAVKSVLQQSFKNLELIVVDNSQTRKENAIVRKSFNRDKRLKWVTEPRLGLSYARNKGISSSCGKYIAFIDDDAIAHENWARELLDGFRRLGSKTACLGGRILPKWLAHRPKWLGDDMLGYLSIVDWGGSLRPLKKNEWIAGCNIAFERRALVQVGGFSTKLGRYGNETVLLSNEELFVCNMLKKRGREIGYAPKAVVDHQIPASRLSKEWFFRRASWQAVSDFIANPELSKKEAAKVALWLRAELLAKRLTFFFFRRKADSFSMQMTKIYVLTRELISGCPNLLEDENFLQKMF